MNKKQICFGIMSLCLTTDMAILWLGAYYKSMPANGWMETPYYGSLVFLVVAGVVFGIIAGES